MSVFRVDMTIAVTGAGPGKGDTGFMPGGGAELVGINWHNTVADTGANAIMDIKKLPRAGDSGDGFMVWTKTIGASDFFDYPVQPVSYGTGADNSGDSGARPIYFAPQDRLAVKVRSTSPISGRFYAWFKSDRQS